MKLLIKTNADEMEKITASGKAGTKTPNELIRNKTSANQLQP